MSVSILIRRGNETIEDMPLSNQPFITETYVPAAEQLRLSWLPLIIRAAGLVVDAANKNEVIAELGRMDENAHRHLRHSKVGFVLSVNQKIRAAILEKMTEDDISLDIA